MFYEQLFQAQISKAPKDSQLISVFFDFVLLVSTRAKAAREMLVKSTPDWETLKILLCEFLEQV